MGEPIIYLLGPETLIRKAGKTYILGGLNVAGEASTLINTRSNINQ